MNRRERPLIILANLDYFIYNDKFRKEFDKGYFYCYNCQAPLTRKYSRMGILSGNEHKLYFEHQYIEEESDDDINSYVCTGTVINNIIYSDTNNFTNDDIDRACDVRPTRYCSIQ